MRCWDLLSCSGHRHVQRQHQRLRMHPPSWSPCRALRVHRRLSKHWVLPSEQRCCGLGLCQVSHLAVLQSVLLLHLRGLLRWHSSTLLHFIFKLHFLFFAAKFLLPCTRYLPCMLHYSSPFLHFLQPLHPLIVPYTPSISTPPLNSVPSSPNSPRPLSLLPPNSESDGA